MQKRPPAEIRRPRVDDRPLWDVMLAPWGYPAFLIANQMKLFELLAEKPLGLDEVCAAKQIARRPAEALLAVCTSLGFMTLKWMWEYGWGARPATHQSEYYVEDMYGHEFEPGIFDVNTKAN